MNQKYRNLLLTGEKTLWEKEKMLVTFSHNLFKGLLTEAPLKSLYEVRF